MHQLGALVCRQCLTFCGVGCKGSKIFSLKFLCQLILKKSETRTSFLYGSSYLCLGNAAPSHVALGSQPSTWSVSAQHRPESPSRWQQLLVSRLRSWAAARTGRQSWASGNLGPSHLCVLPADWVPLPLAAPAGRSLRLLGLCGESLAPGPAFPVSSGLRLGPKAWQLPPMKNSPRSLAAPQPLPRVAPSLVTHPGNHLWFLRQVYRSPSPAARAGGDPQTPLPVDSRPVAGCWALDAAGSWSLARA